MRKGHTDAHSHTHTLAVCNWESGEYQQGGPANHTYRAHTELMSF